MVKEDFKNENDLLRHIMTVDKNVEQGRALKKIFTTRENPFSYTHLTMPTQLE